MQLYYWPIKARNVLALLICKKGGLSIEQVAADWPAMKDQTIFGQLPMLVEDDGSKVCQSMAIYNVLSRRAGLQGASDKDYAMSCMLLEVKSDRSVHSSYSVL